MKLLRKFWANVPIAHPVPLNTLIGRTADKIRNIQWRHPSLRFCQAASIIESNEFLCELKFKRTTLLQKKGAIIAVTNDAYIPKRISLYGYWAKDTSKFLSTGIKSDSLLVDIGAHCGLVSLQVFNQTKVSKILMVEPLATNALSVTKNFGENVKDSSYKIINSAVVPENLISSYKNLVEVDGFLYQEIGATMNSSIVSELPGYPNNFDPPVKRHTVKFISARQLCTEILEYANGGSIVLKIDIQGMDVRVLSEFSPTLWSLVTTCAVEITALNYCRELEINILIDNLSEFDILSSDAELKHKITLKEIKDFYLSKSGASLNIFARKRLG